jgi:hypothetical protein
VKLTLNLTHIYQSTLGFDTAIRILSKVFKDSCIGGRVDVNNLPNPSKGARRKNADMEDPTQTKAAESS